MSRQRFFGIVVAVFATGCSVGGQYGHDSQVRMPVFPWPPPSASAEQPIRNSWLAKSGHARLGDVAAKLEDALQEAGYVAPRYSSVPHGFALVTRLEQINVDGSPVAEPHRFLLAFPSLADLPFVDFLRALAYAPTGHYRIIVFVVSDQPATRTADAPIEEVVKGWYATGMDRLPAAVGNLGYDHSYRTIALVYEFEKRSTTTSAQLVDPSSLSAQTHLERAHIWNALMPR